MKKTYGQSAMPNKNTRGGGSSKLSQKDPNGSNTMKSGRAVDKHVAWKGDGGAKNGRIKGC
jgi:hypothetical protein